LSGAIVAEVMTAGPFGVGGIPAAKAPRRGLFAAWLLAFYTIWAGLVISAGSWPVVRAHWPISVAMAGGSFVGGSTPVAGGTVGFPVLVYLFDHPARLGRDFSLAVQSIGMVSASIYILTRGRKVEWRILRFAMLGAAVAMPVGMSCVAPNVADGSVKILFSVVYASFGLLHLARLRDIVAHDGRSRARARIAADPAIGLSVGVLGGLLASVLGVGADILMYGALVLLYRADIRVAIPTAVILMAFTSLVGVGWAAAGAIGWPDAAGRAPLLGVFPYWLAAAPVVAVGGPLGSLVSKFVPRRSLLGFVAVLCLAQYAWTCYHQHLDGRSLLLAAVGVLALNLALHGLFAWGRRANDGGLPADTLATRAGPTAPALEAASHPA
jgi:uncharacterized membrane protein YfcA